MVTKAASEHAAAGRDQTVAAIQELVRQRFRLAEQQYVSVSEFKCHLPNCPPRETLIMFWSVDRVRTALKIHKGLAEIVEDDLTIQGSSK